MNNAPRLGGSRSTHDAPASFVRRFAAFCLTAWVGMSILIQLLALFAFDSLSNLSTSPPALYKDAVKLAGQPLIHGLLRYQVAADTYSMLSLWGWLQLGLAAVVFLVLLLFSSVGRVRVGFSLVLLLDALLIAFALIPTIDDLDRRLALTPPSQTLAALIEHSHLADLSFVISQSVVLLLCLMLLWLLVRRRRVSHSAAF